MKIKIKKLNDELKLPRVINKGEWIDLYCSETTRFSAPQSGTLKSRNINGKEEKYRNVSFDFKLIPLGVIIKVPKGFESIIAPRSSTAKGMGVLQGNSIGIVDNAYCGPNDEWKFPALAIRDTIITAGERICQFRIQLSQKATFWQKLKWLFSSKVEIEEVDDVSSLSRGGFGSTGNK